ncbi:hypothetical protein CEXT_537261 [Caerostris extrusa]|uniref:Uncharacterized protein n=1 Tax=Caerostris extrusa TaxID=172846 RepID=A0AAV4S449_CAEEX|nr:hypothetical protein CEXT_537261 [Caerostris extrusa]
MPGDAVDWAEHITTPSGKGAEKNTAKRGRHTTAREPAVLPIKTKNLFLHGSAPKEKNKIKRERRTKDPRKSNRERPLSGLPKVKSITSRSLSSFEFVENVRPPKFDSAAQGEGRTGFRYENTREGVGVVYDSELRKIQTWRKGG